MEPPGSFLEPPGGLACAVHFVAVGPSNSPAGLQFSRAVDELAASGASAACRQCRVAPGAALLDSGILASILAGCRARAAAEDLLYPLIAPTAPGRVVACQAVALLPPTPPPHRRDWLELAPACVMALVRGGNGGASVALVVDARGSGVTEATGPRLASLAWSRAVVL